MIAVLLKYKLEDKFLAANAMLAPENRRQFAVDLADEMLTVFGFAGIIGTSAAVNATAAMLRRTTHDVPESSVDFAGLDRPALVDLYREHSDRFIFVRAPRLPPRAHTLGCRRAASRPCPRRSDAPCTLDAARDHRVACTQEAIQLDPSVTSATTVVQETFTALGKIGEVRKGLCEQYVIGIANRDPSAFKEPNVFNPMRDDLFKSLTFNGRGFAPEEVHYPRICPGRYLALTVIRQIIDLIVKAAPTFTSTA
jgi:cytochrome P450